MLLPKHIKASGKVDLWETVRDEKGNPDYRQVELPATDAVHALTVDPGRWSINDPREPAAEAEAEPEPEVHENHE